MANVKISELPAATSPLSDSNTIPVVQSGTTKQAALSSIGFLQTGTGATLRTAKAKMADIVSVKDFGAVGDGVTNDTAAFNLAIAACSTGQSIYVPVGNYIVTVASLVYGTKVISFNCAPGALINGGAGTEGSITAGEYGNMAIYGPHAPTSVGPGFNYNKISVNDAYPSYGVVAGKVDALNVLMYVGGANAKGGRHGIESTLILNQATSPTNFDRNYVGIQGVAVAYVSDNGTAPSPQGAVFGFSALGVLATAATNYLNLTGGEVNVGARTGTSVSYKSGLQICAMPDDAVKGSVYDVLLSLSNQSGAIGWDYGLMFSAANGAHPVSTTGTLIGTNGAATVAKGVDFSSYTITGSSFKATNIDINSTGIEIGALGTSNTPIIDFHSSANNVDYDARIIASGGSATIGQGSLTFIGAGYTFSGSSFEFGSVAAVNTPFFDFHSSGNNIDYDARIIASGGTATLGQGELSFLAAICVLPTSRITSTTVGGLLTPVAAGVGGRATVTDATATLTAGIGAVVVGGGANIVPVFSDGTNWRIG
jgi:hypothetical protein